jgi:two-component sensor histidine kinase
LRQIEHGRALAEAIVDTVREPLVVLDRDLRVVSASRSFYRTFAMEPRNTIGRMFYQLDEGQWDIPALRRLLQDVIPGHRTIEAYEIEHDFPTIGRRIMLLNARQVFDEAHPDSTLLLAIEDVTQRRDAEHEKDELLRQKEVLLQEMQHRVANSLQIIASILLLKARTVQSEETRLHLRDAHERVMSLATVQQQLQASRLGDRIEVGPYLSKLCDSLAKSMIRDRRSLALTVEAGAGTAESSAAVSIGLIITELVINALKHAFPPGRQGRILVRYEIEGDDWRLSVSDNGIGRQDLHERTPPAWARASSRRSRVNSTPASRCRADRRGQSWRSSARRARVYRRALWCRSRRNEIGVARLDLLEKCRVMLVQDVSMIHFLEVAKACFENSGKIRTIVAGERAKFGNCFYDRNCDRGYLGEKFFFE